MICKIKYDCNSRKDILDVFNKYKLDKDIFSNIFFQGTPVTIFIKTTINNVLPQYCRKDTGCETCIESKECDEFKLFNIREEKFKKILNGR